MPLKKRAKKVVRITKPRAEKKLARKKANDGIIVYDPSELEKIEIINLQTYFRIIETYCDVDYVLFRGQNSDWPLLPKLSRIKPRDKDLRYTEKAMMDVFKRLSKPRLNSIPPNEWEWLAVAQHHGLATRLLDWTSNPLAALWFAVSQPATSDYGVIWVFYLDKNQFLRTDEIVKTDPFTENTAKVFQPELSTTRVQVQSGWFTTQQVDHNTKKFIAFDKIPAYRKKLVKLKIPAEHFSSLRSQLDKLAINRYTLFPDIDGTASHVEWLYSLISDETEKEKSKPALKK